MKSALLLLLLTGCALFAPDPNAPPKPPKPPPFHSDGRVRAAIYDTTERSPTGNLRVFQQDEPMPGHKVIAFFSAHEHAGKEAEIIQSMIEWARHLGADGLQILRPDQTNKSLSQEALLFRPSEDRTFRANAVILDSPK